MRAITIVGKRCSNISRYLQLVASRWRESYRSNRMKIENIEVKPYEGSIFPAMSFEVEISYTRYGEAIMGVNGWLETDDGKIVAEISGTIPETTMSDGVGAKGSSFDVNFGEEIYKTTLITLLDKRALDHIERRRMGDRKGDAKLTLSLNVKSIESKATISPLHAMDPESIGVNPISVPTGKGESEGKIIVYAHDSGFSSRHINRWILSGDNNPIFLSVEKRLLKEEKTIPSSDWIHDYAPKLGLGEYFIVEIPKGNAIIGEAWNYIEDAEECYRRWDTKGVYINCREVGTLLDEAIKTKFEKDSFVYGVRWERAYKKFNEFASLNLHLEDIKKSSKYSIEDIKISKADAEHVLIVTKALIKYAGELLRETITSR